MATEYKLPYTASDINNRLRKIDDLALRTELPTTLADLEDDTTHRLVTDTEKSVWNSKANISDIPTKVSELANDANYETKSAVANTLTSAKSYTDTKIGELSEGFSTVIYQMYGDDATNEGVPTIREIANEEANTALDTAKDLIDAIEIPTVPTNISAFTNDKGYLTEHQSLAGYAKTADLGDLAMKDNLTKSEVGLGNVDNVKQYSASNPPPYPVTKVNNKTGAVTLSASDVGALPSTTKIPTKVSDLTNDSGFITSVLEVSSVEPAEEDIPKVFFGTALPQTKDNSVMSFRYISKTQDIKGYCKTKAQGNSSISYPKKNQTVNLYKDADCTEKLKVDFKGWGEQSKFCFKANWIDLTHARNVVSARLWGDVVKSRSNYVDIPELLRTSPNQGAIDGFPVKVYAGGVYQGRYTINIPKDAWMANMDDELDTHCILCGENYVSGCFRADANIDEGDWTDEVHDTVPNIIKTRWNEAIRFVMNSTDDEFVTSIGNYFDVESLIDYYLFGLVSCGLDAFGKNQLYMTYNGLKWYATMYDMDSTWGLWWNGSSFVPTDYARNEFQDFKDGDGNLLYIRLENLFVPNIKSRWEELRNDTLSLENIINRFERFTDITSGELIKEDYASSTAYGKFTNIPSKTTNNIQQIRAFATARLLWADEYVDGLPVHRCTGISLSASEISFDSNETKILTATVTPNNCDEPIVWTSSNTVVATVNDGIVTPVSDGYATITATCGSYSALCSVVVTGLNVVYCTGISLDKTSILFDSMTNQTLIPTVTPQNTTDTIMWNSSNVEVVTVDNGLVTAVGEGYATITATCGSYSTMCHVNVAVPIYSLPEPTTFDGSNYIDTGVQLFAEDKPFTLILDWTHTGESDDEYAIAHSIHEENPWNGLSVQYLSNDIRTQMRPCSNSEIWASSLNGNINAGTTVRIAVCKYNNGEVILYQAISGNTSIYARHSKDFIYTQLDETLLLGCYRDINDEKGRFAKGILSDCKVYDHIISENLLADYLIGNEVNSNALYPFVNAVAVNRDNSELNFAVSNGNHIVIREVKGWQLKPSVRVSDLVGFFPSKSWAHEKIFTIPTDAEVTITIKNILFNSSQQVGNGEFSVCVKEPSGSTYTNLATTTVDNIYNNNELVYTYTASNTLEVGSVGVYMDMPEFSWDIQFDIEMYVNGVRYV